MHLLQCKTNFFFHVYFWGRNLQQIKEHTSWEAYTDSFTLVRNCLDSSSNSSALVYTRLDSSRDSSALVYIRLDSSSDSPTLVYIRLHSSTFVYTRLHSSTDSPVFLEQILSKLPEDMNYNFF